MKKCFIFFVAIAFIAISGFSGNNPCLKNKYLSYYTPPIYIPPTKVTSVQFEKLILKTEPLVLGLQLEVTV